MGVRGKERAGTTEDVYPLLGNALTLYNGSGGEIAKGQVCLVDFAKDDLKEAKATPLSAAIAFPVLLAVATEVVADTKYGVFQTFGEVDALVEGTTDVAAGNFLKVDVSVSTTGFIKDGTSRSAASGAIAKAAQADNSEVLTSVFLLGQQCTVLAS